MDTPIQPEAGRRNRYLLQIHVPYPYNSLLLQCGVIPDKPSIVEERRFVNARLAHETPPVSVDVSMEHRVAKSHQKVRLVA